MRFIINLSIVLTGIFISILITWGCITSGIDWRVAKFFERNPFFIYAAIPGVIAGLIIPFVFIGYYLYKAKRNKSGINSIIAKKLILGFICSYTLSSILKSFTNRMDMEPFESLGNIDFSNGFRYGFLNSNSLWESLSEGWPSGHVFIATTFLIILQPSLSYTKKRLHYVYLLIIMLSVVTSFHWFSDIISGLILGIIIGKFFQLNNSITN